MGVVDAGLQREPGFLARFGEVVAGGILVAAQRDAGNAAAVGGGLTALFAGMSRTRQAVCTVGRDTRQRIGAAGHPGKAHESRAAAVGTGKDRVGRAHGKAVLALGIGSGRERDGPTLGVLPLQEHALVGQGGIVMVEGAVLVAVDVEPAGQAVERLRADAHVQVGAGIGVEQVAARIEGAGTGVVGKDVAGLGDERIARHPDADLVGLARAQARDRGLGADGRGLVDAGRAAGLAELGGLAPAGAAAGHDVAGVTRVVVDLGRRTVGVVDAHARIDGRRLDGLQVVGAGIEARSRVATVERARDIGRAIAHEGQDVDHVGDVDLPKRLAQGIEGDVVMEGLARLDLLPGDGLLQHEARRRVDGDGSIGRLGAGLEATRGGVELAVRISINGAAADHGLVAQGCAVGQCQCQLRTEGDVGQVGATFQVGTHVRGDVRVGPGQAGETLRGGVLFHLGLDGLAALAAAGGHIAHAARQHVGDGDGAGVGRQHGGVARLQLEGECGAGSHGLGGVGRLDDLLGDAGGGARLGDLQVVTQRRLKSLHQSFGYVVSRQCSAVTDDGAFRNLGAFLAYRRGRGLNSDGLGPGLAQFQSRDVQVGTLASRQVAGTLHIGDAAGRFCILPLAIPGDGGVCAVGPGVLRRSGDGCGGQAGGEGAVGAGKVTATGTDAILHGTLTALGREGGAEMVRQVERGPVNDFAHRQVPEGDAAFVGEHHTRPDDLAMGHVVDEVISGIGRIAYGTDRRALGGVGCIDLAGVTVGLVDQFVRERIIAGSGVLGGLIADGGRLDISQSQRVLNGLLGRVVIKVRPENQGLAGDPVFVGWNGASAPHLGWRMGKAGVDAGQADPDDVVVRQTVGGRQGFTVAAVGNHPVFLAWPPYVTDPLVGVDAAAGQLAGSTLPDAAAAVGKAAAGQVGGFSVGASAPVVQTYRLRVAGNIETDLDGFGGIKLFDPFLAVAAGIAGHQAHHHAMVEAVFLVGAAPSLESVGHGVAGIGVHDHHVVERGSRDGQCRRQRGRGNGGGIE